MTTPTLDLDKPICLRCDKDKPDKEKRKLELVHKTKSAAKSLVFIVTVTDGSQWADIWYESGRAATGGESEWDLINYTPTPEPEQPIDWSKVEPGTKVLVRSNLSSAWYDREFAVIFKGNIFCQSESDKDKLFSWTYCKLAAPEPAKEEVIERWVNVYDFAVTGYQPHIFHLTKEDADKAAEERIACVKVSFRKGDGL